VLLLLGAFLRLGRSSLMRLATTTLISLQRTIIGVNAKISGIHKLIVFTVLLQILLV
jgi:hypothetical protein